MHKTKLFTTFVFYKCSFDNLALNFQFESQFWHWKCWKDQLWSWKCLNTTNLQKLTCELYFWFPNQVFKSKKVRKQRQNTKIGIWANLLVFKLCRLTWQSNYKQEVLDNWRTTLLVKFWSFQLNFNIEKNPICSWKCLILRQYAQNDLSVVFLVYQTSSKVPELKFWVCKSNF